MFNSDDVIRIKKFITTAELAELWRVSTLDIDSFIEQGLLQVSLTTLEGKLITVSSPSLEYCDSLSDTGSYECFWSYKVDGNEGVSYKYTVRITKASREAFEEKYGKFTDEVKPIATLSKSKEKHYQLIIAALISKDEKQNGKAKSCEHLSNLLSGYCEKLGVNVKSSNWSRLLSESCKYLDSEKHT